MSIPTRIWFGEGVISPSVAAHLSKHRQSMTVPAQVAERSGHQIVQAQWRRPSRVVVGEGVISPSVQRHLRRA
jgi:hypothetical protein